MASQDRQDVDVNEKGGAPHTIGAHAATGMSDALIAKAQAAAEIEKHMSFRQAVKLYWKGGLWSMGLSIALVMEGFDVGLLKAFYGQPAFLERFGTLDPNGNLHISANWQAGLSNAVSAGQVCGLLLNGWASYKFGHKRVYCAAMITMIATIFIPVFATSLSMLLAGNFINGIPWGVFQTLTTAYAAEICPMALRAHLTSFVNICWAMGLFIAAAAVRGSIQIQGDWSWRLMYCLQWAWPVPLLIVGLCAPESPWWLARQGRKEEAKRSIRRTARAGHYTDEDLDAQVALMDHTHEIELQETKNASLFNCFKGTNLRRLEICCVVWSVQYWCGQPMTGYSTYFLRNAGLTVNDAFSLNLGNYAMLIAGTLIVWAFINRVGRRTIYLVGQALMAAQLGCIGILGCVQPSISVSYGIGAIMLVLNLTFACTVGPTCYTIVGELPSAEVRAQTIVLARASYVISGIINSQLTPRMLSVGDWNWGAKCGFFFLGTNIISFIYCYYRLPESQGRTYGELDILFTNKVPARQFPKTNVAEFESHEDVNVVDGDLVDGDIKQSVAHVETK